MLHLSNLIFTELLAENDSLSAETMSKMQAFVEKLIILHGSDQLYGLLFRLLMLVILIQPFLMYLMDGCFE